MSDILFFALYPRDFIADTAHLGNCELGIYWRLLLHYYQHGKPFPNDLDRICRVAYALTPEERKATEYVLGEYFHLEHNGNALVWRHHRADREMQEAKRNRESAIRRTAAARAEHLRRAAEKMRDESSTFSVTEGATGTVTNHVTTAVDPSVTSAEAEAEAEAEADIKDKKPRQQGKPVDPNCGHPEPGSKPNGLPPCPHQQILDCWAELMPELQQPRAALWKPSRADYKHLAARWREGFTLRKAETGEPYYTDLASGLEWWRRYFRYLRDSTFLMREFRGGLSLPWLVKAENFIKTLEGKYHDASE
jgi:uncharacterized protein YdaU (DUF1376 family)